MKFCQNVVHLWLLSCLDCFPPSSCKHKTNAENRQSAEWHWWCMCKSQLHKMPLPVYKQHSSGTPKSFICRKWDSVIDNNVNPLIWIIPRYALWLKFQATSLLDAQSTASRTRSCQVRRRWRDLCHTWPLPLWNIPSQPQPATIWLYDLRKHFKFYRYNLWYYL